MSQIGKLTPNLDKQSTQILNLTVLQRIDPFVEEILITTAHVTFYEFNIDLNQWSRKDVEGSLFVVKRNTKPRFQFIVMNRRNTDNLVENLLGDFEYEVQVPYLLYRKAAQEVNGIWFYNSRECEDVANLFSIILNAYSKVPPKPKVSTNKSNLRYFLNFYIFEDTSSWPQRPHSTSQKLSKPMASPKISAISLPSLIFIATTFTNACDTCKPISSPTNPPPILIPLADVFCPLTNILKLGLCNDLLSSLLKLNFVYYFFRKCKRIDRIR
ncbi:hypothetical protein ACHQM5_013770 [Ranunculus cassubicifolius]